MIAGSASAALVASELVNDLIEASSAQSDLTIKMSIAGIGGVLGTAACVLGLRRDLQLTRFRYLWFLVVPLVAFVLSLMAGYWNLTQISGFRYEIMMGVSVSATPKIITDASAYFKNEYLESFRIAALVEVLSSMIGMVTLATWYAVNVALTYGARHATNPGNDSVSDLD